ncbi:MULTISPECIES: GNAT family N-acetyltransferase [Asanoa]|uniref:GNAT family N-acetyltransferase n=1 Tax=Asanoa TaxID=195964 RepID=UPI0015C5D1F4|nr:MULTISPECIES: GNAT family N-acetyltransferase [Asanoa]
MRSFLDSPIGDWLIADRGTRRAVYERCFTLVLDHAFENGIVQTTADLTAVALWYPTMEPAPDDPDFEARLEQAAGEYFQRYAIKMVTTAPHHPTDPHHHLAFLGVEPERQGEGIGTVLLREYLGVLDSTGTAAYLEATNPRNRALYQRHGFVSADPVYLPEGPPLWPMWRPGSDPAEHPVAAAVRRAGEQAGVERATAVVDRSGLLVFGAAEDLPDDVKPAPRPVPSQRQSEGGPFINWGRWPQRNRRHVSE